jgi:hypothetical protein
MDLFHMSSERWVHDRFGVDKFLGMKIHLGSAAWAGQLLGRHHSSGLGASEIGIIVRP